MRVFPGFLAFLGAFLACVSLSAQASITDYPFRLVTKNLGAEQELVAENDGPASITVFITLTGENFASDRNWPATVVVPPQTALPVGRVFSADKSAGGYNFLFRYSHHFGRLDASHDAGAVYRLPFQEGHGYPVTQAYGGRLTSHNNRENLYAVDFSMPVGTPIMASRGGVVVDSTVRHKEGGFDMRFIDKANTVAIMHDDGTVAEYAHLAHGSEVVRLGQRVAAGDHIGFSGNTGYSSGPHLHFIVSRPTVNDGKVARQSVPVLFYANDQTVRFAVQAGVTFTANYKSSTPAPQLQQARQDTAASSATATGGSQ